MAPGAVCTHPRVCSEGVKGCRRSSPRGLQQRGFLIQGGSLFGSSDIIMTTSLGNAVESWMIGVDVETLSERERTLVNQVSDA